MPLPFPLIWSSLMPGIDFCMARSSEFFGEFEGGCCCAWSIEDESKTRSSARQTVDQQGMSNDSNLHMPIASVLFDARTVVKDPVCGMDIDTATAAGHTEHDGQTYHFCSPMCKEKPRS